jgi:ectoine hydroxylase-related dioxygenase (phytanoyl-CoA dioxygenase family)
MAELEQINHRNRAEILAAVGRDGGCIALNVLPDETCDSLLKDFEPHLNDLDWGMDELGYRDEFYGNRTKRLHGLFEKSGMMTDVLCHPLFSYLSEQLFIEPGIAREVRLSNTEVMALSQDQGNQMFHTDGASWGRAQQSEENEILISANIALTDFTADNGATRVVPGSHRWHQIREPGDEEVCLATMPRGSALIYSGNLLHSGGENRTPHTRTGLYLGFIPSWLRPIENQLVTNSPDVIFDLPEDARRLLDVSPGGFTVMA